MYYVNSQSPIFSAKQGIHNADPALDSVIIPPDCAATIYNMENKTFSYNFHSANITNIACNESIGHVKAILNITGLTESCDTIKKQIMLKVKMYASGTDPKAVYDPHGTGKGYVETNQDDIFFRLSGVGGKGLRFYQDTVQFNFSEENSQCNLNIISQSQVSAGEDDGTNLCNIYNLVSDIALKYASEDLGIPGSNFTLTCCDAYKVKPCFLTT